MFEKNSWLMKRVAVSSIVLICLLLILALLTYLYFTGSGNTKLGSLLGGLSATFVAVVIQFILAIQQHREIDRLKDMGFQKILARQNDRRAYYAELLRDAKKHIDFLGKTASSFLEDFAHVETGGGGGPDDKLLIDALERKVKIRILVVETDSLPADKQKASLAALETMKQLAESHPNHFEYRLIKDIPGQTYVMTERGCIFGPIFSKISSRNTPTIRAESRSPFLEQYLNYFECEWDAVGAG